jgi:hypothetical protein
MGVSPPSGPRPGPGPVPGREPGLRPAIKARMVPAWLHWLSWGSLALAFACALVIAADVVRRPQRMAIMNVVWPVTALFGSVLSLAAYRAWGRGDVPFPAKVVKGALHCGSGCTLGDVAAETLSLLAPGVLAATGLGWLFDNEVFARWTLDFVFAFAIGIVFQYFAIAPMRHLGLGAGLRAAVKADTLSLCAWQLGMYGFMAVVGFAVFPRWFGVHLRPSMPEFWFAMQGAMLCGLATSYPVNWWLIRRGLKEAM